MDLHFLDLDELCSIRGDREDEGIAGCDVLGHLKAGEFHYISIHD